MAFNTDKASSFAFVKLLKEKLGGEGGSTPDASSNVKGKLLAYAEKVLSPITASTYNAEYINTALDDINTSIVSKADTSTVETLSTQLLEKAPINHASSNTEYGIGDDDNYGHVKLQASSPFKGNEDVTYKLENLIIPVVEPVIYSVSSVVSNFYIIGVIDYKSTGIISWSERVMIHIEDIESLRYEIEETDAELVLKLFIDGGYYYQGAKHGEGNSSSSVKNRLIASYNFNLDGTIKTEGLGLTLLALEKLNASVNNDGIAMTKSSLNLFSSPRNHSSTTGEYGVATTKRYGHVILRNSDPFQNYPGYTTRVPTCGAILQFCAQKNHSSTTNEYGLATNTKYGHIKINDTTPFGSSLTDTAPTVNAINTYCMPKDSASYRASTLDWSNIERINIDELFTVDVTTVADKMSSQPLINEGLLYRNIDNPQLMSFIKPWECLFSLSGQINIADLIKLNSSLTNTAKLISVMEYNPGASYSPSNLFLPNQINTIAFGEDLAVGTTAEQTGLNSYVHIKIDFILNEFTTN